MTYQIMGNLDTTVIFTGLIKIIVSTLWFLFLILGATTIQQIKEMQEVVQVPNKRKVWVLYSLYVTFAITLFVISMSVLWLP